MKFLLAALTLLTGLVVAAPANAGAAAPNGTRMQLWDNVGNLTQQWRLVYFY